MRGREFVAPGQHAVAKVPRLDVPNDVDQPVDEQHPGKCEVIVSPPHAVAHRASLVPGNTPVRELEKSRVALVAGVPPVEFGKVQEDVDTADHQIAAGNDVDPVADPDTIRVACKPLSGAGPQPFGRYDGVAVRVDLRIHPLNSLSTYSDAGTLRRC